METLKISDLLFTFLVLSCFFFYIKKCTKRGDVKDFPKWFLPSFITYHFLISGISVYYIKTFGGDSIGYWELNADTSQNAQTWMDYWGYNTFFIQWLNYVPFKVLNLNYLTGCLIYSCISFLGFFWLVSMCNSLYSNAKKEVSFLAYCLILVFFLPNQHFWTGIVGKEAILWFALMMVLKSVNGNKLLFFLFGIGLLIWIRPILGTLVMGVSLVYWLVSTKSSFKRRLGMSLFFGIGLLLGLSFLGKIMHLGEFSFQSIKSYTEFQYAFLEAFEPNTLISMQDYNLFQQIIIVGFKPFPNEISSIWGVLCGFENLILAFLSLGIFPALVYTFGNWRNFISISVLLFGILIFFISISISVNVVGIMVRLKSSIIPFLSILGWFGWFLFLRQRFKLKEHLSL